MIDLQTRRRGRPLLICDCDEVLLHMVAHFEAWLDESENIHFDLESGEFADGLTYRDGGHTVPEEEVWPLLEKFFRREMHRQTLVPGAREALETLGEHGDIVILTNIGHEAHGFRVEQLRGFGLDHEVVTNRGGKGRPVLKLLQRHHPSAAVFVDDLHSQHRSVKKHAPGVRRLHMVAEPRLAPAIPASHHAHARIDDWALATQWILEQWGRS
ncbi:HAD family hydrolase [Sphingomicrobium aestuariivivum]|uniref:HAD family hydrolase n=1 Tax=Sphingomicrobium aestuariivivum TaxID=1582356 RepID=UPI001FD70B5F|nr:HAD family hydrolase [Sphingomicrobium aestuariivivum]MCJ8191236.1 HAD family hydrolase [Sphingomicrobium aestuariivivum]